MFGKKLSDINTKNKFSNSYFEKKGLINKDKNFFFYRKTNLSGSYYANNEFYLLELNKDLKNYFLYFVKGKQTINFDKSKINYFFSNEAINLKKPSFVVKKNAHKSLKINNYKKKYWGEITSLFNDKKKNLAGKIIFMKKNTQSSLEFHVNKIESYFIEVGSLNLGVRFGRAKQSIINLKKNSVFKMNPGVMHMRMAIQNTFIVEISTFDEDSDSHLVEDGKFYNFVLR